MKKAAIVLALPIFLFDKKHYNPSSSLAAISYYRKVHEKRPTIMTFVKCLNSDVLRQIAEVMNHLISDVWSLQF